MQYHTSHRLKPDMDSMADARRSRYQRRRNRPVIVSATPKFLAALAYLSSAVTGECIVPESFMGPSNWHLTFMVTVSKSTASHKGHSEDVGEHDMVVEQTIEERRKKDEGWKKYAL